MKTGILKKFGLHENDVYVYEALFGLGRSKTGPIITKSGVGSSQTYLSLARLVQRGLASYQVKNNVRYYQAELPDVLIDESKKNVLELEALSQEIQDHTIEKAERNVINTYEGKDGFRKAFSRQYLELVENNETIYIVGFTKNVSNLRELRNFLKKPNQIAEDKHCAIKMVLDERFRDSLEEREGPQYEIRFLSPQHFTPMGTSICKKEVLLSVWGKTPLAISISEPTVVKSFKQNFEVLWNLADS
jgi:sugar-specific transcriptional regulator TrmB